MENESLGQTFNKIYFGDLSFLLSSLVFDVGPALRMKVDIVREQISKGEQNFLDEALQKVPDVLSFRMDTN